MKRLLCLLTAAAALFCLASCGEPAATEPGTEKPTAAPTAAPTEEPTQAPSQDDELNLAAFIKSFNTDGTIEEQIIYDTENLTVTAKAIEYDPIEGPTLLLTAENNSDRDILLQTQTAAVNGYMVKAAFDLKSDSGKKADGRMTIPYPALALAGLDRVARVEFSLIMLDQESYEVISSADMTELVTTAAEGYEAPVDDSGQEVYNKKGVRIVLQGVDDSRAFTEGPALIVYMENDSKKNIAVQAESITVNGYEFTCAMNTAILPHKRAVDTVTFFDMDMEEYGIEEIESVSLKFKILDSDEWKELADTDIIEVEL